MPLYAFRWTGEDAATTVELPDENAAWSQAFMTTGQMLRELDGTFPKPGTLDVEVHDEAGRAIGWISITTGHGSH